MSPNRPMNKGSSEQSSEVFPRSSYYSAAELPGIEPVLRLLRLAQPQAAGSLYVANKKVFFAVAVIFLLAAPSVLAQNSSSTFGQASSTPNGLNMPPTDDQLKATDSDHDGLSDYDEIYIYRTDPHNPDSDGDGYTDGDEVKNGFDPNKNGGDKLEKNIDVDLKTQTLTYNLGPYQVGQFLISSGVKALPTPPGNYTILKKIPVVDYKGADYDYPNTKWNMMFKQQKPGNPFIHGAYWHHNFGHPMSHGCINVAYVNMGPLYNWADVGTKVTIQ